MSDDNSFFVSFAGCCLFIFFIGIGMALLLNGHQALGIAVLLVFATIGADVLILIPRHLKHARQPLKRVKK
jgi:hypothetical protein